MKRWTRPPLDDLERLDEAVSYLAERHHFTAYLQESGFVEGWLVKDWVRGGKGGLGQVMAQGLTSLMRLWAQMRAQWSGCAQAAS